MQALRGAAVLRLPRGVSFTRKVPNNTNVSLTTDLWLGFGSAYIYEVDATICFVCGFAFVCQLGLLRAAS